MKTRSAPSATTHSSRRQETSTERSIELQGADIFWNDIEKYCSHLPEGGGRIGQCLATKRTSLTPACQTETGKFQSGK